MVTHEVYSGLEKLNNITLLAVTFIPVSHEYLTL